MAEIKKVGKTAESGDPKWPGSTAGITSVGFTPPVLADKVPEPGETPPEPTIKIAGLETLKDKPNTELKEAGDTVVGTYQPTEEELAKLAMRPSVPGFAPEPAPAPERVTLIPPSIAARTMAEMQRGKEVTEAKAKMRRELLGE